VHVDVPPTLHWRADGVMLRWNTSRGGGPYYVRVTSPDLDLPFVMVVVAPPVYWQVPTDSTSWSTSIRESTELSVSAESPVLVDLGFSFPFFGLTYDRVWVSSAGYLAFERPPQTEGFVGLDAVHSAVVAAAGEYDLARSGATLAVSRFGATELEVAWHAPLFGSSKFTDVALRLVTDGSIGIRWERIVLGGGGSLEHKLLPTDVSDTTTERSIRGTGASMVNITAGRLAQFVAVRDGRDRTFLQAEQHCRQHYDKLASIHTATDKYFAEEVCAADATTPLADCYIGLNDLDTEGEWRWSDGVALDYNITWAADDFHAAGNYGQHWASITVPVSARSATSFKFNLDPADDKSGMRGWSSHPHISVQLAELSLYDPDGFLLSGAAVVNPVGLDPLRRLPGRVGTHQTWSTEMAANVLDGDGDTK
jgi:hypothetical protein